MVVGVVVVVVAGEGGGRECGSGLPLSNEHHERRGVGVGVERGLLRRRVLLRPGRLRLLLLRLLLLRLLLLLLLRTERVA